MIINLSAHMGTVPSCICSNKHHPAESTDRAEILVTEGDADGGMAMAEAAEKFREDHDKLHTELTTPERTKSVCEVCGVFVNSTDNEQRRLVRCWQTLAVLA